MSDYDELNYLSQKFEKYKIFVPHEERTSIAAIIISLS